MARHHALALLAREHADPAGSPDWWGLILLAVAVAGRSRRGRVLARPDQGGKQARSRRRARRQAAQRSRTSRRRRAARMRPGITAPRSSSGSAPSPSTWRPRDPAAHSGSHGHGARGQRPARCSRPKPPACVAPPGSLTTSATAAVAGTERGYGRIRALDIRLAATHATAAAPALPWAVMPRPPAAGHSPERRRSRAGRTAVSAPAREVERHEVPGADSSDGGPPGLRRCCYGADGAHG